MPEAPAAPAPAAASTPAPASSPAPAAPSSAPASTPAAAQPTAVPIGRSGVTSAIDPAKYPIAEEYAAAVLKEKLAGIPADVDGDQPSTAIDEQSETKLSPDETPAPISETEEPKSETKPEKVETAEAEEDFQLEPEPIVTPESLSKMVTDNPEFGKLLEADPKLKGQLYKTAREAAELQPYREIFPDLDSAKSAHESATTFNDVRNVFMGSTTREGTMLTLGKIAELSYERDDAGNVVQENGAPKIGEDFFQFVDHTVALDLGYRKADVEARLKANQYHLDPATKDDPQAAYDRDQARLVFFDDLMGQISDAPASNEQLPEHLRRQAEDLDRRERALTEKQHTETVAQRQTFETGLQTEAQTRLTSGIGKIIASVKKQGGVISPYLETILPKAIAAEVVAKIVANPGLKSQMNELQRLPIGDASHQRRIAAIDRAYQQYLPDVAREHLRNAGIQITAGAKAKADKVAAQAQNTQQTEIKGATGPSGRQASMTADSAFTAAQAEWQKANPGKPFEKTAREQILPRVLQLMTAR